MRFRKSVKIMKGVKVNFSKSGASLSLGGRGHSVNLGGRGVRVTNGIPGTGLSHSTNIGGGRKKTASRNKGRAQASVQNMPRDLRIVMNENGDIIIQDSRGNLITDQTLLRRIKATDAYKQQKAQLELLRQERIDEIVRSSAEENSRFVNIIQLAPNVDKKEDFESQYVSYVPETYDIPAPTKQSIEEILYKEAVESVKAPFWKREKMRKQFVADNIEQRFREAFCEWENEKEQVDRQYLEDFELRKQFARRLIDGDSDAICEAFDDWISSCELPVEININYEVDSITKNLLIDVDLPEIEDLPETYMTKTDSGKLKEKKKTQADRRDEYATCVFGLAVFISANAFNLSPEIKQILISGYTQRRDKEGKLKDDYIYSLIFSRNIFEGQKLSEKNSKDYCMSFKNRCNMTSTSLFKAIKPFDGFEED